MLKPYFFLSNQGQLYSGSLVDSVKMLLDNSIASLIFRRGTTDHFSSDWNLNKVVPKSHPELINLKSNQICNTTMQTHIVSQGYMQTQRFLKIRCLLCWCFFHNFCLLLVYMRHGHGHLQRGMIHSILYQWLS